MPLQESESSYYKYLTERMDRGESNNIVIPTAVELIKNHLLTSNNVNILDLGCFNGAMLNQIRTNTPAEIRHQVTYTGGEVLESLIEDGKIKYPQLSFVKLDLKEPLPKIAKQDIVILSNVIHEVVPERCDHLLIEKVVLTTLKKVSQLLKPDGDLLILDGIKPNNDEDNVEVHFANEDLTGLFKLFAQKYLAFDIHHNELGEGTMQTRVKDLAAFLTKARYLFEGYWDIEAKQLYQYFNEQQFTECLQLSGFDVAKFEPQRFTQEHLKNIFAYTTPQIEYPAKNVLIVANKKT